MSVRALFARNCEITRRAPVPRGYNVLMTTRRSSLEAAIPLALVLSIIAAAAAIMLDGVTTISRTGIVAAVAVVGFVTSWVRTGRLVRTDEPVIRNIGISPLQHPVI